MKLKLDILNQDIETEYERSCILGIAARNKIEMGGNKMKCLYSQFHEGEVGLKVIVVSLSL